MKKFFELILSMFVAVILLISLPFLMINDTSAVIDENEMKFFSQ